MWANFHQHFITNYKRLLVEGGGATLGQDGHGGAYHTAATLGGDLSITESIVKYVEQTILVEPKDSNLEQRSAQLEVSSQ